MMSADPLKQRVYYSQNREDLILEAFFPATTKGFYIDVGANDPVTDSVTKLFYDKGWNGINIEPLKNHFESLEELRPRDINLNIGLGAKADKLTLHSYTVADGLSTFSKDIANVYATDQSEIYQKTAEYQVEIKTLNAVLTAHKIKHIDFMKVDVEGFEYEVLKGNDWNKFRPEVICIEANHIINDWRPLLIANDYKLTFFDGLNEYYADNLTLRAEVFDYVEHLILQKHGGLRYMYYKEIESLSNTQLKHLRAIELLNLRLQDALSENSQLSKSHQILLEENHNNHIRAAIAERALRNPVSFLKFQIKRIHRRILFMLGKKRKSPEYTDEEKTKINRLNKNLPKQLQLKDLEKVKLLAKLETDRLERLYAFTKYQPKLLTMYLKIIYTIKRIRLSRRG